MSGYYAKVSNISGGKSCVSTSAYISRDKMKDEQMNHTFNYSGHEHDNTFSNVTLCKNAPEEWQDKEKLWNAVEEAEKGKNARKAKQWILAIPQEMTQQQAEQAVKDFQEWMAEKGMCSQADIHEPDSKRSASQIEKNKHVHVLATQRLINEQGEWEKTKQKQEYANDIGADGKPTYNPEKPTDTEHRIPKVDPEKVAEWEKRHGQQFDMRTATAEDKAEVQKIGARNRKEWVRVTTENNPLYRAELIEESRAKWAEVCNKHLSAEQQIDHRSYDRQGIDKVAQIHEGIGYHQQDERAEYNRTVKEVNENMERMKSQAPETLEEIRGELNEVRESLEHDGNSQRTARTYSGATADYPGTETSIRYTESQIEHIRERAERLERTQQEVFRTGTPAEESRFTEAENRREPDRSGERSRILESGERERESQSREFSERADRIRTGNEEVKSEQLHNDFNLDRMGRQIQFATGKIENIGAEQRSINEKANSLRDKLNSIRERIIQVRDSIRQRFSRTEQTEQPDNSTRPTSQNTQPVKENSTMPGMSRFAQIQAEQKLAREKEPEKVAPYQLEETLSKGQNVEVRYNDGRSQVLSAESSREDIQKAKMETSNSQATMQTTHQKPQDAQKDSVREKLERFTREAKEGRTEPLQSDKQEQTEHIHHRRGHHR